MRFLNLLALIALVFSLSSCFTKEEDSRRFKSGRDKQDKPRKRNRRAEQNKPEKAPSPEEKAKRVPSIAVKKSESVEPVTENVIFPVKLSPEHKSLILQSSDSEKITISAEPKDKPIQLVAGLSGSISLTTTDGLRHLILSSPTSSKKLHLELKEAKTSLKPSVQEGASVNQREVLAETTESIVFYVQEAETLTILCLYFKDMSDQIQVIKNFEDHEDCSS